MTAREFAETWSLPPDRTLNDAMYVFAEDYAQWVRMRVQVLYVTLEKAWEIDPHADRFMDALNALREFVELPPHCPDCIPNEGEEHHKACPKGWGRISDEPAQGSEARPGVGTAVESNTADEKECSRLASRVEELENLMREIDDVPYMVIPDGCGNGKPCDSCVKVVAIVNRALAKEGE